MTGIPLGKATSYPTAYDPSLLFPVARQIKRDEIGVGDSLPFVGSDLWTAYEVSWLNERGKPQVAIGEFVFPCTSPSIVESKSLKLYLNSFYQHQVGSSAELTAIVGADLGRAAEAEVAVRLFPVEDYQLRGFGSLSGRCIDELDVACDVYDYQPELLTNAADSARVAETLYSQLLKSNCLITSQPDWATLVVSYEGPRIDPESLLRYIVSFRNHNEFHEQCVERIYQDITRLCAPEKLTVYARYTRRGGLDINPWRSSHDDSVPFMRLGRQ